MPLTINITLTLATQKSVNTAETSLDFLQNWCKKLAVGN